MAVESAKSALCKMLSESIVNDVLYFGITLGHINKKSLADYLALNDTGYVLLIFL
jgi:hypothetical protein